MKLAEMFRSLDRRWIFLLIGLSVALPLLFPLGLPEVKISTAVRPLYDYVEKELDPDGVVLLACDYDPGSKPELQPMAIAVMHHLRLRGIRFVVTELWPGGLPLVEDALEEAIRSDVPGLKKYEYGVDYAHLGYKAGGDVTIRTMGENLRDAYPKDTKGTPVEDLPVMDGIERLKNFSMVISISAGTPGTKEWVQQAQSRYKIPMGSGCTAVSAPDFYPYVNAGQLIGVMGGLAGAAEYENLVGRKQKATKGMEAQSLAHLLIILFIVLGNVGFLLERRRRRLATKGGAA
jgi:hypothetical protein